ncbi:guanylate kinase [Desulfatiglans anilini]|uniref:guanylate kinase n=1 Tax=Desulfatiglans anilini TaxID=90728 RepID=UPI00040BC728|nr:guanylate kinase [Desulfatiglans anilini]
MPPGQIFIFSAPSGGGKSTIIGELRKRVAGLGYAVSHTSRPPRKEEREGVHYYFVDRVTFERMIGQGAFVEWAPVYDALYGTSFMTLEEQTAKGLDVVMDVDVKGARSIRRRFPESVSIYIVPPSIATLAERLRSRGTDSESAVERRLRAAAGEIHHSLEYDYIIVNHLLEDAVKEAEAIILAARCRTARREMSVRRAFPESFAPVSELVKDTGPGTEG